MLSLRTSTRAPVASAPRGRAPAMVVRCSGDGYSSGKYQPGMKVRVIKPITIYSVPKNPDGVQIEGFEGLVFKDVSTHNGKQLSAGQPIVVKFEKEIGEKTVKFQAHLAEDEIEAA